MHLRLLQRLNEHADRRPDALAIREVGHDHAGRSVTYAKLRSAVNALSARLAEADFPAGACVLLSAPNQAEFIVAFLGILAAGLRVFPVSPDLTAHELSTAAARSAAAGVIAGEHVRSAIDVPARRRILLDDLLDAPTVAAPSRSHDSAALLLQSSGTTGRPKIVLRDAASLDAVASQMVDAIDWRANDHGLAVVPLCHSYGVEHGLLCPIWAGSAAHLCRGFDLRIVRRELTEGGITMLPGVPFMFEMLAQHAKGSKFPTLRRAYSAGGPLPRTVYEAFLEQFGIRVSQLYGATEIGSVTYADPAAPGFDPASVGRAMRGVSIRVLDVDRADARGVEIRATSMLSGYVDDDDETSAPVSDGYFSTGDLGRLNESGNLTITGRLKLLIDIGGLKVNPIEVEDSLAEHPQVNECIVLPVRVSETVNRLKAIVTPRDAGDPPTAESLRRFARERLVAYKVPRVFEVRRSLPKSATGKVLRHQVEE